VISAFSGQVYNTVVLQQTAADAWLLALVRRCAAAYRSLVAYDCGSVIKELDDLPAPLKRAPFVLSMYAKAYFEMMDYKNVS
jgi:hypothetical protein